MSVTTLFGRATLRGLAKACGLAVLLLLGLPALTLAQTTTPLQREAAEQVLRGHLDATLRLYAEAAEQRWPQQPGTGKPPTELHERPWTAGEAGPLAEALMASGRYDDARELLQRFSVHLGPATKGKTADPDRILQLAEVERQIGRGPDRLKLLTRAAQQFPKHVRLRVLLGEQLYELGKRVEARKLLDPLADLYEAGEVTDALDLAAVARSLWLNGYVRDASQVFDKAAEAAAEPHEQLAIELAWGQLFVEKYNYRDGDKSFKTVLGIDPHHGQAQVGMARIDVASDHDIRRARTRLDTVLERNPRLLEALVLRAEVALHDEDYPTARELLGRATRQRPDFPPALYVQGALAKLTDDAAGWKAAEAAVAKLDPDDGRLHLTTATYLELAHRYREVRELLQVALQKDSELWQAHAALGIAYARVADDKKAKDHLETAYSGDPFDVRTANQLSVLYDGVLPNMVLLQGPKADLRVHKKDRKALERTVLPFLQESVAKLSERYGFSPARPLQIEIFPSVQQFSVRTVGLPQLGAHAVCFGHLITSRSPLSEPFNWKMVLFHELAHVYHIQATDGRVPRWLTEGLAMMESAWADPRWRLRADRRAYDRLKAGELARIDRFNLAFSQARSMQDILDAYYQSMLLVEFLAERYGFDKLRQLVAAHKSGRPTGVLVREIMGTPPDDVDRQFAGWLGKKLDRYDRDFRPSAQALAVAYGLPAQVTSGEDEAATPAPTVAGTPLRQAVAHAADALRRGDARTADVALDKALATPPATDEKAASDRQDLCAARYLRMVLAIQTGRDALAVQQAAALAAEPAGRCDGTHQRLVLARDAKQKNEIGKIAEHLRVARRLDPGDASVAMLWLELASQAARDPKDDESAQEWLKALGPTPQALRAQVREVVALEPNDPRPPALLGRLAWQQKAQDPSAVTDLQLAWKALEESAPGDRQAPLFEARYAVAAGKPSQALVPYRLAAERSGTPRDRSEAWCELVDAARAAGAPDDEAEARRRCEADKPPVDRQAPKGVPPGGV